MDAELLTFGLTEYSQGSFWLTGVLSLSSLIAFLIYVSRILTFCRLRNPFPASQKRRLSIAGFGARIQRGIHVTIWASSFTDHASGCVPHTRQLQYHKSILPVRSATRHTIIAQRSCREHSQEGCGRLPVGQKHRSTALVSALCMLPANPALAAIHTEPSNALSLPTWAIHISSTVEWGTAMYMFWRYAEVTGNQRWKGLTWGMLPLLGGAMSACTYHFFYNSSDLDFLVALQAFLTVLGNATCAWAAYRIYQDAQASSPSS